ncbi:unnamed protein product [Peronospora effusa]|uniref:Serine/threonine-protein phosphatase PGAM5, mitochondrial n=1 Tax=Peronospora effusa TaxID=542832 RepID=A0A3M6VAE0_9STRA|nr:hypothetical protein DD238_005208 [Peronospora effusa]RQM13279.1 hypothetical protein DD237_005938 [Peronospora effusa]CAI5720024.1 unnamed protein product [Peronospora effusa]
MSLEMAAISTSNCKKTDDCSVKMEAARIQELSLAGNGSVYNSSKRKQRPESGTVPTDLTLLSTDLPTNKRRGNKRTLLTLVPDEARRGGEVIEVEGLLMVAEQIDRGQTQQNSAVFRTLGSFYCVLVRKSLGLFLETVSKDSPHTIVLNMDTMDLVHEPFESNCNFQLRYRQSERRESGNRQCAFSYVFMTSTKEECDKWRNGILRHQASDISKDQKRFVNKPLTSSGLISGSVSQNADSNVQSEEQQQRQQTEGPHEHPQPSLGEFLCSTPSKTKHFIMVRHGHYINAHMPQVSDSQQVLSQMGRQQAELTGKHLEVAHARIPTRHHVSVYHSDMTRAVETAAIIATYFGEVSLNSSSLLREGWPGTPYSSDFTARSGVTAACNNGAFQAMQKRASVDVERMEKAFNWFFFDPRQTHDENDEETYCVLVCHANLIRFFLCRALGVDPATTWGHFEINHCGVTRIDVCADRPIKVIAVNETGHLPLSLITSSEDHL